MDNRDFSNSVQFEALKNNIQKNHGQLRCEICKEIIPSVGDCHFDHIFPYSKGGKSILSNCQILCVDCNLKKNDKDLNDFVAEEMARRFLSGASIDEINKISVEDKIPPKTKRNENKMTKELFDEIVAEFIKKKGDIRSVDFSREYNHLPSFRYVGIYYGDMNHLKKAFGIEDLSLNWNRETIRVALQEYVKEHGDISGKDFKKANQLPSIPCILNNYPEFKTIADIRRGLCGLDAQDPWTKESVIEAGKAFLKEHDRITEKDCRAKNNLPTMKVIYRFFGSMRNFQNEVGSKLSRNPELITKENIIDAVEDYFFNGSRVIESRKVFFELFPYSYETIIKRFGSFEAFCLYNGITVINQKRAKYSKQELDESISSYVKSGKPIPTSKELVSLGLPSRDSILKYYDNWKDPFILYQKLFEKIKGDSINGS